MSDFPAEKLFDALLIDDEDNHDSGWVDVQHIEKLSLHLGAVKVSTPGDLTVTVFVSPQAASVLNDSESGELVIAYDKLLNDAGHDAPVALHAFSATAQKFLSMSPEDAIRSIKVRAASASTTDATKTWTLTGWLVGQAFAIR